MQITNFTLYFNIFIIHKSSCYSKFIKHKTQIMQSITFFKKIIQQNTFNQCVEHQFQFNQINCHQLIYSSLRSVFQYDGLCCLYKTDRTLLNLSIQSMFFKVFKYICQLIEQIFYWVNNLPEIKILLILLQNKIVSKIFEKILNFIENTLKKAYRTDLNLQELDSQNLNPEIQKNQFSVNQKQYQDKIIKSFIQLLRKVILSWKIKVQNININIKIYMKVKDLSRENSKKLHQIFSTVSITVYKFQLSYIIDGYLNERQCTTYTCLNCEKKYQHKKLFKHIKLCKQKYQHEKNLQNNYKAILPKLKDVQGLQAKIQKVYKEKSKQSTNIKQMKKSQFFFTKKLSKSHNFEDLNEFTHNDSFESEQQINFQKKGKTFQQLDSNQLKQLLKIIEKLIDVSEKIKIARQSTNLLLIYDLRDIKLVYEEKFNKLKVDCPEVKILIKLLIQRQYCVQNLKKNQNKAKKSGLLIHDEHLSLQDLDIHQNHTQPNKQIKFKKKIEDQFSYEYFSQQQITSPSAKYFDENQINLQQFEIIKTIGKGKYASVYLVKKKTTNQYYAMKKIQIQKYKQYYQKNKQCVFQITDSPFVVKAFYSFSQDQYHYFIIQYCPNGDFSQLLQNQVRLTETQSKLYLAQIIMALQYLHSKQIIHRDIKPHNIVIDSQWHLKLTDYGLSDAGFRNKQCEYLKPINLSKFQQESLKVTRFFSKNYEEKKIVGSPYYMAPQIMRGQPATFLSDWWSFGILTYQILIGVPPYSGKNKEQIYEKILQNQLWPNCIQFGYQNDMISYDAKNLIQGLLNFNPKKRLGSKIQQIKNHSFFKGIDWKNLLSMEPPFLNYRQQLKQCKNNMFKKKNAEETKSCNSSLSRQAIIRRDHLNNDTYVKFNIRQAKYENLRKFSRKLKAQSLFSNIQFST